MTFQEEQSFLNNIYTTIQDNPQLLDKTILACTEGMKKALQTETDRAIDMELVAVGFQAMSSGKYSEKNYIWATNLIKSKLSKWPKHNRVNWGATLDELQQT